MEWQKIGFKCGPVCCSTEWDGQHDWSVGHNICACRWPCSLLQVLEYRHQSFMALDCEENIYFLYRKDPICTLRTLKEFISFHRSVSQQQGLLFGPATKLLALLCDGKLWCGNCGTVFRIKREWSLNVLNVKPDGDASTLLCPNLLPDGLWHFRFWLRSEV
jgi:hypothetical protein